MTNMKLQKLLNLILFTDEITNETDNAHVEICEEFDAKEKQIKNLMEDKLVSPFTMQMAAEIEDNAYKGNWEEWIPTKEEWLWEMQHHQAKLQNAIADKDIDLIREYSADVGNLAEKSFSVFGHITEVSSSKKEKKCHI